MCLRRRMAIGRRGLLKLIYNSLLDADLPGCGHDENLVHSANNLWVTEPRNGRVKQFGNREFRIAISFISNALKASAINLFWNKTLILFWRNFPSQARYSTDNFLLETLSSVCMPRQCRVSLFNARWLFWLMVQIVQKSVGCNREPVHTPFYGFCLVWKLFSEKLRLCLQTFFSSL